MIFVPRMYLQSLRILGDSMTPSHRKIYDLIWRRTVASQMIAATYVDVIYSDPKQAPYLPRIRILWKNLRKWLEHFVR